MFSINREQFVFLNIRTNVTIRQILLYKNKELVHLAYLIQLLNYFIDSTGGSFLITIDTLRCRTICLSLNTDGAPSLKISCVY